MDYPDLITQLADLHGGYAALGVVLARTISPDKPPFSRQYIEGIAKRRAGMNVTKPLARALDTLRMMADGASSLQAAAREVAAPLFSVHELPAYTVIIAPARACARPGCRVHFVTAGRARYCSPECRREARRRARMARNNHPS